MTPQAVIAPARLAGACLMRAQSDERLVDLVRAGNERAFEAIVQRYGAALLRHCRRLLGNGRAEDALQQALLRAHAAIQADDRPLNLRPWLFRIATNASLDALRQPGWSHEELDPQIDGVERPDQAAERHEELRTALAAVTRLPPRQRDVIVLRELEGRSYEEIALQLGVSGGAVRQLLHRGRAGLRSVATAVTPMWLVVRLGAPTPGGEPLASRVAELAAGAGGAAGLTKGLAAVLAVGTVAGGVAVAPLGDGGLGSAGAALERQAAEPPAQARAAGADPAAPAGDRRGHAGRRDADHEDRSERDRDSGLLSDDRSGPGGGGELRDRPERGRHRGGRGRGGKELPELEPEEPVDDHGRRGRGREPTEETATTPEDPLPDTSTSDPSGSGKGRSGSGLPDDSAPEPLHD